MTFISIVENDLETLTNLQEATQDEFPDATIDVATNYRDAISKTKERSRDGLRYQVAFLDVRLPEEPGGKETLSQKCRHDLLKSLSHQCLVINYSAYANSDEVRSFVSSVHDPLTPQVILLDAAPLMPWHKEALPLARQAIYGRRVQEALDQISIGEGLRSAGRRGSGYSGTVDEYDLNDLMRDLRYHWGDLNDTIQSQAKEFFNIVPDTGQYMSVNLR